ncbi:unnamed protein product [Gongylonema pulchrum]|uniref:Uncharacterized protein n=1 Tax=Gongylonema pulchrum TaxID=637853 RepID=A0A183E5U6_9BILA|nr:unnamed protein product [Gongylonema pulchrum]
MWCSVSESIVVNGGSTAFTTMKHTDRKDDIPNCPSIDEIVNMPTPTVTAKSEVSPKTSIPPTTASVVTATPPSSDKTAIETDKMSTAREQSPQNPTDHGAMMGNSRILRAQQQNRLKARGRRRRFMDDICARCSNAVKNPASDTADDDIPKSFNVEDICAVADSDQLDDDISLQRFSHAIYQILDDFCILICKILDLSKMHPVSVLKPNQVLKILLDEEWAMGSKKGRGREGKQLWEEEDKAKGRRTTCTDPKVFSNKALKNNIFKLLNFYAT